MIIIELRENLILYYELTRQNLNTTAYKPQSGHVGARVSVDACEEVRLVRQSVGVAVSLDHLDNLHVSVLLGYVHGCAAKLQ